MGKSLSIFAILVHEMRVRKTNRSINTYAMRRITSVFVTKNPRRWLVIAAGITMLVSPVAATAATLISQAYTADGQLPLGSMVSLKQDSGTDVQLATTDNVASVLGVIISTNSSQLSISSGQDNQVQVATSGVEQVLVSDINGGIATGDLITASPISGVGMKATASSKVLGVAQDKFPNNTASKQEYTDKNKEKHKVQIGQVPALINVTYFYKQPEKTIVPAALQNIANALAGKKVNALPILISLAIFIVTLIVVVSIIYALIHSSIISVGRNPMSQSAVYRNVIQLSLLVVIILLVSVVSIYMVLRKL